MQSTCTLEDQLHIVAYLSDESHGPPVHVFLLNNLTNL